MWVISSIEKILQNSISDFPLPLSRAEIMAGICLARTFRGAKSRLRSWTKNVFDLLMFVGANPFNLFFRQSWPSQSSYFSPLMKSSIWNSNIGTLSFDSFVQINYFLLLYCLEETWLQVSSLAKENMKSQKHFRVWPIWVFKARFEKTWGSQLLQIVIWK